MNPTFKKLTADPHLFFDLLPKDWQYGIVAHWDSYKESASIYIIEDDSDIIGGGIVFSSCPPDMAYYKKEAQEWFDDGYLYVGFIWIAAHKRNRQLGSFWLNALKKDQPNQNFWLTTEEEHLHRFYIKNGFELEKTIKHKGQLEWLYQYTSTVI